MKKLFSFLAAGLLLASCSSEDIAGLASGEAQEVTLSFQLPKSINSRATGTNSALGGASNCEGDITFTAAIYYKGTEIWRDNASASIPNGEAAVTFKPSLIPGEEYQIVAYAQMDGEITDFTAQSEENAINDESVDAYYASTTVVAESALSVTLKRATAKLRIIAEDFAATEAQLGKKIKSVNITYRQAQPTVLNPTTGMWEDNATDVEFTNELVVYSNESDARTILVDYIPVDDEGGEIINIEKVIVTFEDNTTYEKNLSTLDIPVKRNYLTTLTGNFFMAEMDLTLTIDPVFDGEEEIILTTHLVSTADEFVKAMAEGGVITVNGSFTIGEGQKAVNTKSTTVNINKGVTITVADNTTGGIWNQGKLTINNEGTIKGTETAEGRRCINNEQGATLILNGGIYQTFHPTNGSAISNIGGTVEANSVTISAENYCIWNEGESASFTINYGRFDGNDDYSYAITNKLGAKMEINNADVYGQHGAVAVTQGAELVINGNYYKDDTNSYNYTSFYKARTGGYAIYADATDDGVYPDAEDVKVTINGADFASLFNTDRVIYAPENCDLTINGGKIRIRNAKQLANSVNLGFTYLQLEEGITVNEKIEFNTPLYMILDNGGITLGENGELVNNTELTIDGNMHHNWYNDIKCTENNISHRCITNNKNGKLTLDGMDLYSPYNQAGAAVYNYGEFIPDHCYIYPGFNGVYNDGGTIKIKGASNLKIESTSTSTNGQGAYAIVNTNGGNIEPLYISSWNQSGWGIILIDAIHGGIYNEAGSTVTLKENSKITLKESAEGAGDSYHAVYCTGEGSVVNVEKGTYTTVRDAFHTENGGVINVSSGVVVNGVTQ